MGSLFVMVIWGAMVVAGLANFIQNLLWITKSCQFSKSTSTDAYTPYDIAVRIIIWC